MFHIALYEPRIAPNTGNIIRLVANNGCHLHLIEPLGFDMEEKKLRRAGLDYAELARVTRHADYPSFLAAMSDRRIFALTTKGTRNYADAHFEVEDVLLFGSETSGLPPAVRESLGQEHCLRVPMMAEARSLNLSNTVALVSYEAWRQVGFLGAKV
ncbi:MAG: tRNA (cytidine/uridine-2'-O-)-methyltransferase [Zhongshania aliphaticivorans]|jgi:tRNA (cytidine/uridine-2'-O-)-methyltransferase